MDPENPDKKAPVGQVGPTIPEIEEDVIKFWEENDIFAKSLEKTKDGEPYTFYDGPPFATGLPHYGHILASTIKDLVPRYQSMRGRFVRRRWGWDCHGLPIEALVEKKLEISGKKQIEEIGIEKFNETCRSMVLQYSEEWGRMVRRMGRWVDFEGSYKTMDTDYMESVWWAFKQVHEKGLAYEGRKVLLYCPRCETPISNFEVAMDNSYKDVSEESIYVKFKITDAGKTNLQVGNTYLVAWTTTPWTLPGNVALAVGSEIKYKAVQKDGEYLVVAADRVSALGLQDGLIGEELTGAQLVGLAYEPLFEIPGISGDAKAHKVYAADFVTAEDGTGIVHTAVVYGEDDYQLGLREGLPVLPLLDEKGHFKDIAPEAIRGQYFKKAEKTIKEDLQTRGLLWKREAYTHSYPHCWRCSTALYYTALPAWFINIQKMKPDLLRSNEEQVNWFPEHLKRGRYHKSVEAAPDWNISRNRYWGNPIPIWKCADCGKNKAAGSLKDLEAADPFGNSIYLVRHTEAEHVINNVHGGPETEGHVSHLTPAGQAAAEEIAKTFAGKKIAAIYSSSLLRTRTLADLIAKVTGAPVIIENGIGEIDLGKMNWHPVDEIRDFLDGNEGMHHAPEGGESRSDVRRRAFAAIQKINQSHRGEEVVVISHGDPLWMFGTVLEQEHHEKVVGSWYPKVGEVRKISLPNLPYTPDGKVDLHRPYIDNVLLKCDCGADMHRTPEIFDSWVEAGSMPFSEYHYPFENKQVFESRFPAQFVAEYIAQTRAWFYVMHVMSQILFGKAPFENVVTTGNILAEDGSKMSKSKNNYPDPWLVIGKYGVDTLRFYLMNSVVMQADDMNFNEKDLETVHRKVTMILWNVQQYFTTYSKQSGWKPLSASARPTPVHVLDKWIVARGKELVGSVTENLDSYNTVQASKTIAEFVDDLSTWYLRRSRGRDDASFFPAFQGALITLSQVLAPFMPHVAEAVYQNARAEEDPQSVHLCGWPEKEELSPEEKVLLSKMAIVRSAASWGLMFRKGANIPVRQPLGRMAILVEGGEEIPEELLEILLSELNVKKIDQSVAVSEQDGMRKVETTPPIKAIYIDTNITDELRLEGEVRKIERAIQERRKEMGMKVGEMASLTYSPADADAEAAWQAIDKKKTYISEIKKGAGPAGIFELEKVD